MVAAPVPSVLVSADVDDIPADCWVPVDVDLPQGRSVRLHGTLHGGIVHADDWVLGDLAEAEVAPQRCVGGTLDEAADALAALDESVDVLCTGVGRLPSGRGVASVLAREPSAELENWERAHPSLVYVQYLLAAGQPI